MLSIDTEDHSLTIRLDFYQGDTTKPLGKVMFEDSRWTLYYFYVSEKLIECFDISLYKKGKADTLMIGRIPREEKNSKL